MADWSSGLCACCTDCGSCCYGLFCSCCLEAKNWELIRGTRNPCCVCCMCPIGSFWIRQAIRTRKHMPRSDCMDCIVVRCCFHCANCQHKRELDLGFGIQEGYEYYAGEKPHKSKGRSPRRSSRV